MIRKDFLPRISLQAAAWGRGSSIQYNDQFKNIPYGWGFQRFNYLAGVSVSYNLFNGIYRSDQLAINRAQQVAADEGLAQQRLQLQLASSQADRAMRSATDNYHEIPVQLQAAQETYRQKLAQYRAGIISLIDLNNASFVLYRSQIDYAEALTDLLLAKADKAAALGTLDTFIQSFK